MSDETFCNKDLVFVWDEQKNQINIRKHGISFQTASFIFHDPLRLEQMDAAHSTAEEIRYITIGMVYDILTVVYCERLTDVDSEIRLISARPATRTERNLYNNAMYGRF